MDHQPLRRTPERLIDFDLLNSSKIRLTINCVNVETGDQVTFDNHSGGIEPLHLLASTVFLPLFPPVEVAGQVLCDAGYVNNTPLSVVFDEPRSEGAACLAQELYALRGSRPQDGEDALKRAEDLMCAGQTRRAIRGCQFRSAEGSPPLHLVHASYCSPSHEVALRALDYAQASVRDRWSAGIRHGAVARAALSVPLAPGFMYTPVP